MEQRNANIELLDLMVNPVFTVQDGRIHRVNQAAARLLLTEGTPIASLLCKGQELYTDFSEGSLYVTLSIFGTEWGASVTWMEDTVYFALDQQVETGELRALALAARELRAPLAEAMLSAEKLKPSAQTSQITRDLYQLLRIIGNMSDASGASPLFRPESRDADALMREILEKVEALTGDSGRTIRYEGLKESVICLLDWQQVERAVLNMLSNALKFTPAGSTVTVSLTRQGNFLYLRVADTGSGIPEDVRKTVFQRHLRAPAIEDSRYGIGLGMLLIRNTAANHGGAVLIDHPNSAGTRVTMTLEIRNASDVHSSRGLFVDYAGEQDHARIELSELIDSKYY